MHTILNRTPFPKNINHCPKIFLIDAKDKILGRLASDIANLLLGKTSSYYTSGLNQGNFVIVLNTRFINVSGQKENQKYYYKNSQRPGNLKKENFNSLRLRIPTRILEKAVWGMLPKTRLGRVIFKNLYTYKGSEIFYKKRKKSSLFIQHFLNTNSIKYE